MSCRSLGQKWETLSTVGTMPCPGKIIERSTLCCKTFQDRRNAGILVSFQTPSWGKALTWKTGIFLHHFFFSTFLVLRRHLIFQGSGVFPWNDTTQLWSHWGKKGAQASLYKSQEANCHWRDNQPVFHWLEIRCFSSDQQSWGCLKIHIRLKAFVSFF